MTYSRADGRRTDELRPVSFEPDFHREHCTLASFGETKVICYASIEERVPQWLLGSGRGWLTAEYSMLPTAALPREPRNKNLGGRAQEIQRLVGRSLRAALDLSALPPFTIRIDADVLVADGGTRTAAICGGFVSLASLIHRERHRFDRPLLVRQVAAVSVGILDGQPLLDPDYSEDRDCAVDGHVVKTADGKLIDIGFTAEGAPFAPEDFSKLLALADQGLGVIFERQRDVIPGGLTL